ncbi:anti-anti-sigma factor [Nonomuraea polychroma]|uniref:Anti-anti-sigma factor n=1 Tax=Nonomuraea polychroma TaxID=46176 RepID=A0A438LYL6_9ACTN|nr:STAS domain-containing protein [Nonomuraea polychroma]RVX38634.1 anti-anti-sigma factor [Nonomuraea polychroma]
MSRPKAEADGKPMTTTDQLLYVDHLVRVTCTVMPGPTLIRVVGEIDRTNSTEVLRTLEQARRIDDRLVVDVGGVDFADVTGVRALVAFAERGDAHIRNAPHQMSRLMRLMGLSPFVEPESRWS